MLNPILVSEKSKPQNKWNELQTQNIFHLPTSLVNKLLMNLLAEENVLQTYHTHCIALYGVFGMLFRSYVF